MSKHSTLPPLTPPYKGGEQDPNPLESGGTFYSLQMQELKSFFTSHRLLFFCIVLFVFLSSVLRTLERDGKEIFLLQKGALVLEVFSQTDLDSNSYKLLEEELRALQGVKEVIAVSPDEALKMLLAESKVIADPQWLSQKKEEVKGKVILLPWTYDLHLVQWDEAFLNELIQKIRSLEAGIPKKKAVAEVHYDAERWSLTFALFNYLRWIQGVLFVAALFLFGFAIAVFLKWIQWSRSHPWQMGQSFRQSLFLKSIKQEGQSIRQSPFLSEAVPFGDKKFKREGQMDWRLLCLKAAPPLAFGICSGFVSHSIFLLVLSLSFFSDFFLWRNQLGQFLLSQINLAILLTFLSAAYCFLNEQLKEQSKTHSSPL